MSRSSMSRGATGTTQEHRSAAARAAAELGWVPTTSFEEGLRRYVAWHTAANPEAEPEAIAPLLRRPAVRSLLRRAWLAFAWAAATAVMVIGLTALASVDDDMDRPDVFATMLIVLLPLVLTGGFEWDAVRARWLRTSLWTVSARRVPRSRCCHGRRSSASGHPVMLLVFAVVAGVAAQLPGSRPPLRIRPAATGD